MKSEELRSFWTRLPEDLVKHVILPFLFGDPMIPYFQMITRLMEIRIIRTLQNFCSSPEIVSEYLFDGILIHARDNWRNLIIEIELPEGHNPIFKIFRSERLVYTLHSFQEFEAYFEPRNGNYWRWAREYRTKCALCWRNSVTRKYLDMSLYSRYKGKIDWKKLTYSGSPFRELRDLRKRSFLRKYVFIGDIPFCKTHLKLPFLEDRPRTKKVEESDEALDKPRIHRIKYQKNKKRREILREISEED